MNIGPKLAEKIITPNNSSYNDYLNNPINQNLQFKDINCEEVIKIIDNLKSKTSCGHDGISNKVLKQIKHDVAEPIALIINQSILQGLFPDK